MHNYFFKTFRNKESRRCLLCCRFFSTDQGSSVKPKHQVVVKKRSREDEELPFYPYVKDIRVADAIANYMNRNGKESTKVIEPLPGGGILTEALLRTNRTCVAYEDRVKFQDRMQELKLKFPESFTCVKESFNRALSREMSEVMISKNFYASLPTVPWYRPEASEVQYFSFVMRKSRLSFQVLSLAQSVGVFQCGKPDMYLLLNSRVAQIIISPVGLGTYTSAAVIFRLFFEIKILDKFPASSFYPKDNFFSQKMHGNFMEAGYGYLVRLKMKEDILTMLPHTDVPFFMAFTFWAFRKRKEVVIAQLEQWSFGIGIEVILGTGIDVFTKFSHLSPEQVFQIFKILRSKDVNVFLFSTPDLYLS